MSSSPVLTRHEAGVLHLTINRPEARNSLNPEVITSLTEGITAVTNQTTTRCVLLSGQGTEAFCAGADIAGLIGSPSPAARRTFFNSVATLIEAIQICPVPVVASVHGFALAGGCGLAAACDITLASEDAVFGLPEVGIGLAAMVVMAPLRQVIGEKALAHLVMTAERISARRAFEIGLVSAVHPKDNLDQEARAVCQKLSLQGREALRASKETLLALRGTTYRNMLHELADQSALLSLGPEASEGLTAFTQKRQPSWRK